MRRRRGSSRCTMPHPESFAESPLALIGRLQMTRLPGHQSRVLILPIATRPPHHRRGRLLPRVDVVRQRHLGSAVPRWIEFLDPYAERVLQCTEVPAGANHEFFVRDC